MSAERRANLSVVNGNASIHPGNDTMDELADKERFFRVSSTHAMHLSFFVANSWCDVSIDNGNNSCTFCLEPTYVLLSQFPVYIHHNCVN